MKRKAKRANNPPRPPRYSVVAVVPYRLWTELHRARHYQRWSMSRVITTVLLEYFQLTEDGRRKVREG